VAQRVLDGQLRSTCEPEQAPVTGVREPAAILPPQVQHENTAAVPKPSHHRWPLPTQPPALMTLNDRAASSLQAGGPRPQPVEFHTSDVAQLTVTWPERRVT
jgi:hypothetical protein